MSTVKVFVIGKEARKMRNLDRQFRRQFQLLKHQFLQESELPFSDVLSEQIVVKAILDNEVEWLDRIYSPLVTLWVFLTQVLSADHSCRAAVARLIAHRLSRRQPLRTRSDPPPQEAPFDRSSVIAEAASLFGGNWSLLPS